MKTEKNNFLCVLVTGISGAGKSQTLNCLEDFGFFCVDNLPAPLLPSFADFIVSSGKSMNKVAIGVDVRDRKFFANLKNNLEALSSRGIRTWVLFLDANESSLLRRFSETRRRHPMGKSVQEGIQVERKLLHDIRISSDRILDTSNLTLSELKEMIASSLPTEIKNILHISVYSFGFKYGIPPDADIVMDVRFLPNPNYVSSLHSKTGLMSEVRNYVMKSKGAKEFSTQFFSLVSNCLPRYLSEGKSHLTIAIGCTGGRHRSVTLAELLTRYLKEKKYPVTIHHRDIHNKNK